MRIEVENLRYEIDRERFLKIDGWVLPDGRNALVCGSNGSGKSALAQLLGGRIKAASGEITFDGGDGPVYVGSALEAEILAEDRYDDDSEFIEGGLDTGRTVEEVVSAGKDFASACRLLKISHLLESPFNSVSTGEMCRVLIARALAQRPELLILDRPFDGLDAVSQREMHELIARLIGKGVQILLFGFYNEDLPKEIDHLVLLSAGRIVLEGARKRTTASPLWKARTGHRVHLPHRLPDRYSYDDLSPSCPLVRVIDLDVAYGEKTVFKGLNWIFRQGEHWHIAGPNGSGKSTLLGMISGDNPKAYGKDIFLFGKRRGSGESIWEIKRYFGIVSPSLHRDYRVSATLLETVVSGFYDSIGLYDRPTESQWRIGREWIGLLRIRGGEETPFPSLSFGEQKQALIARAMVKLPAILLLDEPCLGLDERNRSLVLTLIDYIASNSRTHILFVSHDYRCELKCLNRKLEFFADGSYYKAKTA